MSHRTEYKNGKSVLDNHQQCSSGSSSSSDVVVFPARPNGYDKPSGVPPKGNGSTTERGYGWFSKAGDTYGSDKGSNTIDTTIKESKEATKALDTVIAEIETLIQNSS